MQLSNLCNGSAAKAFFGSGITLQSSRPAYGGRLTFGVSQYFLGVFFVPAGIRFFNHPARSFYMSKGGSTGGGRSGGGAQGGGRSGGGGGGSSGGRGQGNGGGWPSGTGNPSGGGRSNAPAGGGKK